MFASVVIGCLLASAGYCAEQGQPESKDNVFKRTGKTIGRDAKSGAKQAGHAFKELGKDIGHGTSKTVKDIGQGMKESAERTGKAAKEAVK
jgi:hypothetical protein